MSRAEGFLLLAYVVEQSAGEKFSVDKIQYHFFSL